MSCFLVPMVQAIATSAWCKTHKDNRNLPILEKMLWGGTVMLIVDHIISGELTWRFPFFTALELDGGWHVMLKEMLTVGVPMCLVITAFWALWVAFAKKRSAKTV